MQTKNIIIVGVLVVLFFLAWSPWITKNYAEKRVVEASEESQRGIIDGCGFNCVGCGVTNSNKVPFGYFVDIEYGCGFGPGTHHERATAFVSFIGTVNSLPQIFVFVSKEVGKEISENEVREYLIKKYNPGTCYGMPPAAPPSIVANFTIALTKTDTGYDFILRDGRCCNVHVYEGRIRIEGDQISDEIKNKFTENWAC